MSATHDPHHSETSTNGVFPWLLPFAIVLALIAVMAYKGCSPASSHTDTHMEASPTTPHTTDSVHTTKAETPKMESIMVKLPNGKELDAYKGGIEDQLVTFLSSDWKSLSDSVLKAKWFDFDNLNFNTGKATIVAESEKQLNNIAEILKAFPDVKIKIGGYTDAAGDKTFNRQLSQDRADAAKNGLAKSGVGAQVTGAEGYGSDFAKYPATAAEEERVTDRRVSVSVRK